MLQKRLIRIIHRKPFLEHTNPLFFYSKILKIQDVYKLNTGLYMYDNSDSDLFTRTHSYHTRNRNVLLPIHARLSITQNSINVAGPSLWNAIPEHIRASLSRNSFKFQYKNYLLSQYMSWVALPCLIRVIFVAFWCVKLQCIFWLYPHAFQSHILFSHICVFFISFSSWNLQLSLLLNLLRI